MSRTHLIIPDSHAHPNHPNDRADWLAQLIIDLKPEVVVHIGDSADMPSLSSYDKGKKSFQGRTYKADIESHLDFQERMWEPVKARKKKMPYSVFCVGNHEHRIQRAIDLSPELDGAISMGDLQLDYFYDEVVHYDGQLPGLTEVDGIHYAHFMPSGVMGKPIGGERPAYSLLSKKFASCVVGHIHTIDYCVRTDITGRAIQGLVAGSYIDYHVDWPGSSQDLWWRGVCVAHGVDNGVYDLEMISIERLKNAYAG